MVGKAASVAPSDGVEVRGMLIKKGFTHRIIDPDELPSALCWLSLQTPTACRVRRHEDQHGDAAPGTARRRCAVYARTVLQVVHFPYPFALLFQVLRQMHGAVVVKQSENGADVILVMLASFKGQAVTGLVRVSMDAKPDTVLIEWFACEL